MGAAEFPLDKAALVQPVGRRPGDKDLSCEQSFEVNEEKLRSQRCESSSDLKTTEPNHSLVSLRHSHYFLLRLNVNDFSDILLFCELDL